MLQATNSSGRVLLHFWNDATFEFLGVQYLDYLCDLLRGDFGTSYIQNIPVADIVGSR